MFDKLFRTPSSPENRSAKPRTGGAALPAEASDEDGDAKKSRPRTDNKPQMDYDEHRQFHPFIRTHPWLKPVFTTVGFSRVGAKGRGESAWMLFSAPRRLRAKKNVPRNGKLNLPSPIPTFPRSSFPRSRRMQPVESLAKRAFSDCVPRTVFVPRTHFSCVL